MNIFSRFLAQWSNDDQLHELIAQWDIIEALAIQTYRTKGLQAEDAGRYIQARTRFLALYPTYEAQLRPFWSSALVGGTTQHDDPFAFVIRSEDPADFRENWAALQHLPAAREALNQLTISLGE